MTSQSSRALPQRLPIVFLFLRFPEPGKVKTRLAADLTSSEACTIYRAMVEMLRDRLLPGAGVNYEICFYYSPSEAEEECRDWLFPHSIPHGCRMVPQPEGRLEERLDEAGRLGTELKAPALVFIGSDCMDVLPRDITNALNTLDDRGSVVGPAIDGGFWLLALRKWQPGLFRGIPYSCEQTCSRLIQRLEDISMPPVLLDSRQDVDDRGSLEDQRVELRRELMARVAASRVECPLSDGEEE